MHPVSLRALCLYLLAALLFAFIVSLMVGHTGLSVVEVWNGLVGKGDGVDVLIIHEIRLPRTVLAILVGATLGLTGAALQGFLRNPLAEPGLLGVSNGATLGAVLALYGGLATGSYFGLPLLAMLGALVAVGLTYLLAGRVSATSTLILAGVAISSMFGAGVALTLNMVPNPFASMEVMYWLMGSVADKTLAHVGLMLPFTLLGWLLMLSTRAGLDALSLGEATATSLGFSMRYVTWRLVLGVALAVGAAVSVSGSIGFIGLVVPHMLRPQVGHLPSRLLVPSALGGALLLLLADIAVRVIPTSGMELRLGVMTSLVGAPFFVLLLFKLRREGL